MTRGLSAPLISPTRVSWNAHSFHASPRKSSCKQIHGIPVSDLHCHPLFSTPCTSLILGSTPTPACQLLSDRCHRKCSVNSGCKLIPSAPAGPGTRVGTGTRVASCPVPDGCLQAAPWQGSRLRLSSRSHSALQPLGPTLQHEATRPCICFWITTLRKKKGN